MGKRKLYGKYDLDTLYKELFEHGYDLENLRKLNIKDRNKIIIKWWKCFEQTVHDNRFNLDFHLNVVIPRNKEKFFNWLKNSKYHRLLKST